MPTILAAEDDVSREQTWEEPVSKRVPNAFLTDFKRQNPRETANLTHLTDKILHHRAAPRRPEGLSALKQTIAAIEAAYPGKAGDRRAHVETGVAGIDATLGGGLMLGAVHELMPKTAGDLTAAAGFAFALAARGQAKTAHTLYIQHDFTAAEYGRPYLPGLHAAGIDTLIYLNVPRAEDVLWAMGEALKCRGFAAVIAEFPAQTRVLDLTMTRRLALAAQDGGALGLILRHGRDIEPNAATTR
ncbi:MAG: hypothetical protein HOP13_16840, partial [Alphaproteobacteria bacterium]|nr:hypothetical protein [Alphaproteobacteria bacterium]